MTLLNKIREFFERNNPLYARTFEKAYQNFVEARQKWQKEKRVKTLEQKEE